MFMDLVLEIRNLSQIVYLLDFQVVFDKNSTNGLYFMFTYEEIEYDNINYVFICATTLHLYIRYYQKLESISHIIILYIDLVSCARDHVSKEKPFTTLLFETIVHNIIYKLSYVICMYIFSSRSQLLGIYSCAQGAQNGR